MRKVISLLLTITMVLSLLVVASATSTENASVYLKMKKVENGDKTVTYTFTLDTGDSDGVGALSFYVATEGLTYKSKVYNDGGTGLDKVFKPSTVGVVGVKDGDYGFYEKTGRFFAFGGDSTATPPRVLKGSVVLVAVTYTINDAGYSLTVKTGKEEGFKACLSGELAAQETGRYNCKVEPIEDDGRSYDVTAVGKGNNIPAYTLDGTNLTVTYSLACAVAYSTDNGATYTRIKTTSGSGDSYVFDLSVAPDKAKIIIVVKGDANGDGLTKQNDKALMARYLAGWEGYESLANPVAADINGDGIIKQNDKARFARYLAGWQGYESLGWEVQ